MDGLYSVRSLAHAAAEYFFFGENTKEIES
jgi:hypothetical protein